MSLGPVVRNRFAHEHAEPPKPHLATRMEDEEIRYTDLGAMVTVGGKLTFRPAYAGERPAVLPAPYKEPPYVPFQGENAVFDPNPKAKNPTPEEIHSFLAMPDGEKPPTSYRFKVGDRVRKVNGSVRLGMLGTVIEVPEEGAEPNCRVEFDDKHIMRCWMSRFEPAEAPAPSKPENYEPQLGDIVNHKTLSGRKTGVVKKLDADGTTLVKWPDVAYNLWVANCDLELVRREQAKPAFDPMTEPLREGDVVEVVYKDSNLAGKRGTVKRVFYVGADVKLDDGRWSSWGSRDSLKLIERPNT